MDLMCVAITVLNKQVCNPYICKPIIRWLLVGCVALGDVVVPATNPLEPI